MGLFAMATRNVLDPDVWWHLKTGEWIVQHWAIPHTDPFSYTRSGQSWTVHEWLCQVGMYGLFQWTGYGGLIVVFAAIISAAFIPLYLRCRTNAFASAAVTLWGALATEVVWGVRPQILSFFLLSLWLLLLERAEENAKLLWWTLPLTLLWVNLHGSVILGPFFIGLFIAGQILEMLRSFSPRARARLDMVRRARSFSPYISCILHLLTLFFSSGWSGWRVVGIWAESLQNGVCLCASFVSAFALFELGGANLGERVSRAGWRIQASGKGGE